MSSVKISTDSMGFPCATHYLPRAHVEVTPPPIADVPKHLLQHWRFYRVWRLMNDYESEAHAKF